MNVRKRARMGRRQFLRQSIGAAGGMALGGWLQRQIIEGIGTTGLRG